MALDGVLPTIGLQQMLAEGLHHGQGKSRTKGGGREPLLRRSAAGEGSPGGTRFGSRPAQGDAIDAAYREHGDWLRNMIGRRFRVPPADAKNLVPNIFARQTRPLGEPIAQRSALLLRIMLNLLRDKPRRTATPLLPIRAQRGRGGGIWLVDAPSDLQDEQAIEVSARLARQFRRAAIEAGSAARVDNHSSVGNSLIWDSRGEIV